MKVALFITCVNDLIYPRTAQATYRVLSRLGHEVVFPKEQTCCGQLHLNAGYRDEGLKLARRFHDIFSDYEVIVSPSASCVGTVRDLYGFSARRLGEDSLAEELEEISEHVFELSEFLVNRLGVTDVGAEFPHRVAYHPTCHSLRSLHLYDQPLQLLRSVSSLELVEFEDYTSCCGFGGMFALKNSDVSVAMGTDKLVNIKDSGAEVLCAVDNSCLTHLGGEASRISMGIRTMHLAEILASEGASRG
ncbi:L-lactate dehydrogenase complex protein LldE [Ferrithrix thermotolerans DSM 19514]|uniref:L-lactate dehydrogenase complex protein LldE n=1 Tax=Ferrithrix thermotolerans DSM 19514 TaxID=1121881 RepID=A0A1M4Y4T0_9ACTN|nr:(Fe-S)-binding protein [Ferrithrix thermotolerans]SHF00679.1 L-lactate dehydrogenase complex protein LldE [Ferrithrix thermotolerans DSM 19514]